MLRIVLPKGSLERATMQLFEDADLAVSRGSDVDYRGSIDDPRVDEVYGLHLTTLTPAGHVDVRPGASMASCDYFEIDLLGKVF